MARNWGIRRQSLIGLAIAALLVGFVGVWGTYASLAGAVIASGQVEPEARSQIVQHQDGGTVAAILIQDGDRVTNGDVLIELDGSALKSDLAIVTDQIIQIGADGARLAAEEVSAPVLEFPADLTGRAAGDAQAAQAIDRQKSVFAARLKTYEETLKGLREQQTQKHSEIEGLSAQGKALEGQLALITDELKDARSLQDKGLIQASSVLELERAARGLEGQIASTRASAAAASSAIAQLDVEAARLSAARQEEAAAGLRDAETKLAQLREQERELVRKIDRLKLRAPREGIVHGLAVHSIGSVIRPADPVLYVVPQDDELTITARIDAAHVDSIFAGQPAKLRFTSFDSRLTPELDAHVLRVSADVTTDNRTGATFYTAELALGAGEAAKLDGKPLLPGMPVEVYIQTGERSPIRYILKPFLDYVERAFRE